MKALRYLLIAIVVMLTAMPAGAQEYTRINSVAGCTTFGQTERKYQFYTTSTILPTDSRFVRADGQFRFYSTSTILPVAPIVSQAAYTTFSEDIIADESASSGPRRDRPGDWTGPMENPIGDGVWAMLVMAAGFLIYRVRTRRREAMA